MLLTATLVVVALGAMAYRWKETQRSIGTRASLDQLRSCLDACAQIGQTAGRPVQIAWKSSQIGFSDPPVYVALPSDAPQRIVHDAWDRPIFYCCPGPVHKNGWDLISCGPNGVYDNGQGDDIVVGEDTSEVVDTRRTLEVLVAALRMPAAELTDWPSPIRTATEGTEQQVLRKRLPKVVCNEPDPRVDAFVDGKPLLDVWRHPIYYRCPGPVHKNGWDLISCGPNGVYEEGGGDDIVVGEDVPGGVASVTSEGK